MTEQEQIRVLREALEDLLNSQSSYQIAQHRDPTGSSCRCHAATELVAAMDKAGQALDDTDPASIQPVAAPQGAVRWLSNTELWDVVHPAASTSDGLIYEQVSRRADPEGHAEVMAQIDEALGTPAPQAATPSPGERAEEKSLADYQPSQWWLGELENLWGHHGEVSADTRRAAKVACDFAKLVFAQQAAPEAPLCQWPTCQPEAAQQQVAKEVADSLYGAAPEAPASEQHARAHCKRLPGDPEGVCDWIECPVGYVPPVTTGSARPTCYGNDKDAPCTCPSGDGSLRWPCPQHPPEGTASASMHASIFVKVWGDAGGGDAGRIALANYAYELGKQAAPDERRNIAKVQRTSDMGLSIRFLSARACSAFERYLAGSK